MEKPTPMDRLLCGDVGFGKTEVALRAAFKAILANKQVAFLCPTTILSMQHYKTMEARFKDFPVRIALLNRFTSSKNKNRFYLI
ncbi:DEAD/DEAH box helicase [Coprobacillaceae bacterium CR2/5/TPMF4]|nr:DEAD/DEAH box helicase [Coprobacillaceae bacterium CR2/5/TPMF4]